ncbi:hypothetical protein [Terriglobus sp. TAA 43]|uniref:hypothetical protein n=1 Tax=Terriglobus sp. TAA 43 TaxID=278961 RepID=UPI000648287D|nr:hypothetical protein [Terriglobus sp. TAA 43]
MNLKKQLIGFLFVASLLATTQAHGQTSEIEGLFHDVEAQSMGANEAFDEADPVLERLKQSSRENVEAALPVIVRAASSPHVSVRRVAATALMEITWRSDGRALLAPQTATIASLLVDPDFGIRGMTGYILMSLRPEATSPLVPRMEDYLSREDAVSAIGGGIAGILMEAAPDDAAGIDAIVRYMGRKDHTTQSRSDMLQSIRVAGSQNRDIGRAVAAWAQGPDEAIDVNAISTLLGMGDAVVTDNQQILSTIAVDPAQSPRVRDAATKALSGKSVKFP